MSKNYVDQVFGTRKIIANQCTDNDWIKAGMPKSKNANRFKLGKCLNCGSVMPVDIRVLKRQPPKRCSFCSNIGHKKNINSNTNSWVVYNDEAVVNVFYKNQIVTGYIDKEDYELASQYIWRISKKRNKFYLISGSYSKGTQLYLHHLLIGKPKDGYEVDHIDGNSLNNHRNNLRFLSKSNNARLTQSRYDCLIGIKGISYNKKSKKYTVDFTYNKQRFYFKEFISIEEAVWCRYCIEKYFNIDILIHNPLFEEYNILNEYIKNEIQKYVYSIINTGKPAV